MTHAVNSNTKTLQERAYSDEKEFNRREREWERNEERQRVKKMKNEKKEEKKRKFKKINKKYKI